MVDIVSAGVAPPLEDPAKPFELATVSVLTKVDASIASETVEQVVAPIALKAVTTWLVQADAPPYAPSRPPEPLSTKAEVTPVLVICFEVRLDVAFNTPMVEVAAIRPG